MDGLRLRGVFLGPFGACHHLRDGSTGASDAVLYRRLPGAGGAGVGNLQGGLVTSGPILTFAPTCRAAFANVRIIGPLVNYLCWWSFGFDVRLRQLRRVGSERQIRSTGLAYDEMQQGCGRLVKAPDFAGI